MYMYMYMFMYAVHVYFVQRSVHQQEIHHVRGQQSGGARMRSSSWWLQSLLLCSPITAVAFQRRVFLHYLPWYSVDSRTDSEPPRQGWCEAGGGELCRDTANRQYVGDGPFIGEYDQRDAAVLENHALLAAAAGIDVILMNLNPQSAQQVQIFRQMADVLFSLRSHHGSRFNVSLALSYDNSYATTSGAIAADALTISSLLSYARGFNVTFLATSEESANGAGSHEVVFVWSEHDPELDVFDTIRAALTDGTLLLARNAVNFAAADGNFLWLKPMVDGETSSREAPPEAYWGEMYLIDSEWLMTNDQGSLPVAERNTLLVASAYPGFDDRKVPASWNGGKPRLIARNTTAGNTYDRTWERALDFQPHRYGTEVTLQQPWVQIITWNDWPEGTAIEPTTTMEAFAATAVYSRRWKGHAFAEPDEIAGVHSAMQTAVHVAAAILGARRVADSRSDGGTIEDAIKLFLDGAFESAASRLDLSGQGSGLQLASPGAGLYFGPNRECALTLNSGPPARLQSSCAIVHGDG